MVLYFPRGRLLFLWMRRNLMQIKRQSEWTKLLNGNILVCLFSQLTYQLLIWVFVSNCWYFFCSSFPAEMQPRSTILHGMAWTLLIQYALLITLGIRFFFYCLAFLYCFYHWNRVDPESVEICCSDMESLAPEAYLSSTIMNFYIR